jgi:hypothetical protein
MVEGGGVLHRRRGAWRIGCGGGASREEEEAALGRRVEEEEDGHWAVRVSWASREDEAQWGGGEKNGRLKKNGPRLGRKAGWAEREGKILF